MLPDDPRHGTYAGASQHWKTPEAMCQPCAEAASRRRKLNRYLRATGRAALVPSLGTVRRIRALRRVGWSVLDIARAAGVSEKTLRNPAYRGQYVHRGTHDAVSAAYERLCMTWPPGGYHERNRRYAQRQGWPAPLAWDDPDSDVQPASCVDEDQVDEVAVRRILDGDWRLRCTPAEKAEVVARWTGSHGELARLTGWKVERYVAREVA